MKMMSFFSSNLLHHSGAPAPQARPTSPTKGSGSPLVQTTHCKFLAETLNPTPQAMHMPDVGT